MLSRGLYQGNRGRPGHSHPGGGRYEADDLIGSIAKKLEGEGVDTVIVSGDKDLMQLITPQVTMYDPMKDKTYGIPEVKERFGVTPATDGCSLSLRSACPLLAWLKKP
jgi:5'-3' exonuclease